MLTERHINRYNQTNRKLGIYIEISRFTDIKRNSQTGNQTKIKTGRLTDKQTEKRNIHTVGQKHIQTDSIMHKKDTLFI